MSLLCSSLAELIQTEHDYWNDLSLALSVYENLLSHPLFSKAHLLSQSDLSSIFGNIRPLLDISSRFIKDCKAHGLLLDEKGVLSLDVSTIAKVFPPIFNSYLESFEPYKEYTTSRPFQLATLRRVVEFGGSDVEAWLSEGDRRIRGRTKAWNLETLLIKPVQRMLKYRLLISRMRDDIASQIQIQAEKPSLEISNPKVRDVSDMSESKMSININRNSMTSFETHTSSIKNTTTASLQHIVIDLYDWDILLSKLDIFAASVDSNITKSSTIAGNSTITTSLDDPDSILEQHLMINDAEYSVMVQKFRAKYNALLEFQKKVESSMESFKESHDIMQNISSLWKEHFNYANHEPFPSFTKLAAHSPSDGKPPPESLVEGNINGNYKSAMRTTNSEGVALSSCRTSFISTSSSSSSPRATFSISSGSLATEMSSSTNQSVAAGSAGQITPSIHATDTITPPTIPLPPSRCSTPPSTINGNSDDDDEINLETKQILLSASPPPPIIVAPDFFNRQSNFTILTTLLTANVLKPIEEAIDLCNGPRELIFKHSTHRNAYHQYIKATKSMGKTLMASPLVKQRNSSGLFNTGSNPSNENVGGKGIRQKLRNSAKRHSTGRVGSGLFNSSNSSFGFQRGSMVFSNASSVSISKNDIETQFRDPTISAGTGNGKRSRSGSSIQSVQYSDSDFDEDENLKRINNIHRGFSEIDLGGPLTPKSTITSSNHNSASSPSSRRSSITNIISFSNFTLTNSIKKSQSQQELARNTNFNTTSTSINSNLNQFQFQNQNQFQSPNSSISKQKRKLRPQAVSYIQITNKLLSQLPRLMSQLDSLLSTLITVYINVISFWLLKFARCPIHMRGDVKKSIISKDDAKKANDESKRKLKEDMDDIVESFHHMKNTLIKSGKFNTIVNLKY